MRISLSDALCRKAGEEDKPTEAPTGQVARSFPPEHGHSPVALPSVPHVLANSRPGPAGALVPRAALSLLRARDPLVRAAGEFAATGTFKFRLRKVLKLCRIVKNYSPPGISTVTLSWTILLCLMMKCASWLHKQRQAMQ